MKDHTADAARSISRNVGALTTARMLTTASTVILMLFLPRLLGAVDYGRLYLAQSLIVIFAFVVEFGGITSIPKAVSRARESAGEILSASLSVRAWLWFGAYAALLLYVLAEGYPLTVLAIVAILGVGMAVNGVVIVMNGVFQGLELMKYPSYAGIAGTLFTSAAGIVVVVLGGGPVGFACVSLLGTILNLGVLSHLLKRFVSKVSWNLTSLNWGLLRDGLPYFLNSIFGVIYYRIDTVMLSILAPEMTVGWYGAAYRFFDSLMTVPNIYTLALFPVITRLWHDSRDSFLRVFQRSLEWMIIAAIPLGVGTFWYAEDIVALFFGTAQFGPSVTILRIFSGCLVLLYADFILAGALLAADRQKSLALVSLAAIFVNVGLNWLLIPRAMELYGNGALASAVVTGITEFFVMVCIIVLLPRGSLRGLKLTAILKAFTAGGGMALGCWAMSFTGLYWLASGVVAAGGYVVALFALRTFGSAEMSVLSEVPVIGPIVRRLIRN